MMYGRLGMTGSALGRGDSSVMKMDTTMSEQDAHKLVTRHGTQGRLPKELGRDDRMKAYEARYVASGGKKSEKWGHRANLADIGRTAGLAGATASAAAILAGRGKRVGRLAAKVPGIRHIKPHHLETAALSSATGGGISELYGGYARKKRASYQSSPGGVAASALTRMRGYTP
jgi:hypothetical protein